MFETIKNHHKLQPQPAQIIPEGLLGKTDKADRFYTNGKVAAQCLQTFLEVLKNNGIDPAAQTFIEPSAGTGAFYDLLPKSRRIGIDIDPQAKGVIKSDFLQWNPNTARAPFVAIGNPPFGVLGSLALLFTNRLLNYCEAVGFILPMSFYYGEGKNQSRINGELIYNEELPANIFNSPDGNAPFFTTCFQIYKNGRKEKKILENHAAPNVKVFLYTKLKQIKDLPFNASSKEVIFVKRTLLKSGSPVYFCNYTDLPNGIYNGIISKDKKTYEQVKAAVNVIDWNKYTRRRTTGHKDIVPSQVVKAFEDYLLTLDIEPLDEVK